MTKSPEDIEESQSLRWWLYGLITLIILFVSSANYYLTPQKEKISIQFRPPSTSANQTSPPQETPFSPPSKSPFAGWTLYLVEKETNFDKISLSLYGHLQYSPQIREANGEITSPTGKLHPGEIILIPVLVKEEKGHR